MPSKLGFQLHNGPNSNIAIDNLIPLRPVALLVVGDTTLLDQAYDRLGAGPLYLYQRTPTLPDATTYLNAATTISTAVDRFLTDLEASLGAVRWAYHLSTSATSLTDELAQFEALAIQRAYERYSVRLCVGNFAVERLPQEWSRYRPVLEAAAQYNALIGVREPYPLFPYVGFGPNANIPDIAAGPPHRLRNEIQHPQHYRDAGQIVGNYRHLRDFLRSTQIPARLVITEIGAGRTLIPWLDSFSVGLGGWRSLATIWRNLGFGDADMHYFKDIMWLDQHVYGQDAEVAGVCLAAFNSPTQPQQELVGADKLVTLLTNYVTRARVHEALPYQVVALPIPLTYTITVSRLRVRALPSMNTKFVANFDRGESFTATHYTLHDGWLWLKHHVGWSAYAPLVNGIPNYQDSYLEGPKIITPGQENADQNFIGTLEDAKSYLRSLNPDQLYYIQIQDAAAPSGSRQFLITIFPNAQARRTIDILHPMAGDPLLTPGARRVLRDKGQL